MARILSSIVSNLNDGNTYGEAASATLSGVAIASETAAVLAAHNDGDIYELFKVPGNAIPTFATFKNSAVTGGTDFDLGLYGVGVDGAVKDADILLDGLSFATAASSTVRTLPVSNDDIGKAFWELAGDTAYEGQEYIVALTANTVGTADGTIGVNLFFKYAD